jgi:hypothetical protein
MNRLHKKILSVGLGCFTVAASYASAPGLPLNDTSGGELFSPLAPQQTQSKQKFTPTEDQQLIDLVEVHGTNWPLIASKMSGRNAQQCRGRWFNRLDLDLNHEPWTPEEDALLLQTFTEFGSKWTQSAKFLPGRTDTHCRNRVTRIQKKQQSNPIPLPPSPPQLLPPTPPTAQPQNGFSQNGFFAPTHMVSRKS